MPQGHRVGVWAVILILADLQVTLTDDCTNEDDFNKNFSNDFSNDFEFARQEVRWLDRTDVGHWLFLCCRDDGHGGIEFQ